MQGMRIDAFRISQRRQLYALDSSLHSPVCQLTERTEVAHTVAMAVAQGKDGNDDACHASRSRRDAQVVVAHHHHLMVLNADRFAAGGTLAVHHGGVYVSVVALLPSFQLSRGSVYHHIFIIDRQLDVVHIHRQQPFVVAHIGHAEIALRVPFAHRRMVAADRQPLVRCQLRGPHAQENCLAIDRQSQYGGRPAVVAHHGFAPCRHLVAPAVGKYVVLRSVESIRALHHVPLPAHHAVFVMSRSRRIGI